MNYIVERNTYADVNNICQELGIYGWTIRPDGLLDVEGNVFINSKTHPKRNFDTIPLDFGKVTGHFCIIHTDLSSLKGCPIEVGTDFEVSHNKLTSLKYGPKIVGRAYSCADNNITSLRYCPTKIKDAFFCQENKLSNLLYAPQVANRFVCFDNNFPEELRVISDKMDKEYADERNRILRGIVEYQEEYSIWNKKTGKLNKYRFQSLLSDIK